MNTILIFIGTLIMMAGSVILVLGLVLLRITQETLGRMYLSMTTIGTAESHNTGFFRLMADIRGNDEEKKRQAIKLIAVGIVAGLIGAAIVPL